jgi:hypothetical protein
MTEHELADCRDQLNDSQATILVGLIIPNCNYSGFRKFYFCDIELALAVEKRHIDTK